MEPRETSVFSSQPRRRRRVLLCLARGLASSGLLMRDLFHSMCDFQYCHGNDFATNFKVGKQRALVNEKQRLRSEVQRVATEHVQDVVRHFVEQCSFDNPHVLLQRHKGWMRWSRPCMTSNGLLSAADCQHYVENLYCGEVLRMFGDYGLHHGTGGFKCQVLAQNATVQNVANTPAVLLNCDWQIPLPLAWQSFEDIGAAPPECAGAGDSKQAGLEGSEFAAWLTARKWLALAQGKAALVKAVRGEARDAVEEVMEYFEEQQATPHALLQRHKGWVRWNRPCMTSNGLLSGAECQNYVENLYCGEVLRMFGDY
eukprot:Hpha_TRINITY_DN14231_c0_g3::TRINITY_DN14231_c0_g3_i2::g.22489::m.22489